MKATFEQIVKATGKNFTCEDTISGYYRLMCDNKIILDDSACEYVQDEESAKAFFADYLLWNNVPESKKIFRCGRYFLRDTSIKIVGLRDTANELKRIGRNQNFARIYFDKKKHEVFAMEYTDRHGCYHDENVVEILTWDGQYRYGKRTSRPTMKQIKEAIYNVLD